MLENIIRFLIERKVFAFFLMITLFAAGVYSATLLPRESNPEVNAPFVVIGTSYIGSKAIDIEKEITDKIEDEIDKIKNIKNINSTSSDNFSSVVVEFDQKVDIDEKEDEVQKAIDKIKSTFPEDASDTSVAKVEVSNDPIYIFSLSSDEPDYAFKKNLDYLKDNIEKIDGVGEVSFSGTSDYQYSIYLDQKKMENLGLSATNVFQLLKAEDVTIPVGALEIDKNTYPLEINSQIKNINNLEKIIVTKKGDSLYYLKDIAQIKKEFSKESNFSTTSKVIENKLKNKKRSSVFYIKKEQGYNVEDVVDKVKAFLKKEQEKDGAFLKKKDISVLFDWGEQIQKDLMSLVKNGTATTLIVFVLLLFILGFKDAFVASFGIPFAFVLSFIAFLMVGNTINFISLFSLILSIGILVDSDIVMTEGIERRKKEGYSEEEASALAVRDLATPMIAGTLTTVAVFAPLMFLSGIMGEFIRSIPFTVIFVILASQVVSILFIPVLHATNYSKFVKMLKWIFIFVLSVFLFKKIISIAGASQYQLTDKNILWFSLIPAIILNLLLFFKRKNIRSFFQKVARKISELSIFKFFGKNKNNNKKNIFEKLDGLYEKTLTSILTSFWKKFLLIFTAFAFFAFAVFLPFSGKVKFEFFPGGDVLYMTANIEMPEGTTKKETKEYIKKSEDFLKKEEGITDLISVAGNTTVFANSVKFGDSYGNIFIKLSEEAQSVGPELIARIQDNLKNSDLEYLSIEKPADGPPTGPPISFNIVAHNQDIVEKYANIAENILENIDGVINIDSSADKLKTSFNLKIDKEKTKMKGVTQNEISTSIRLATEGIELFDITDTYEKDDLKVVLMNNISESKNLKEFEKMTPDVLLDLKIKNNQNQDIFLRDIATISLDKYQSKIFHHNLENSLKIEAYNEEDKNLNDLVKNFQDQFSEKVEKNNDKDNVEIVFGGAFSEQQKNMQETFVIFLIGIIFIFAILIFYFNSIWLPILIESVILFAFTGSTLGLWIAGKAISFPSMIGLIALSGVVVNNSIMLMHNYQYNIKQFFSRIRKGRKTDKKRLNNVNAIEDVEEAIFNVSLHNRKEIVVKGSSERLRPILLTTLTTVLGILPLIFASPIWAPIAYVIIFGLLFSTFITLFFIPVVYYWTFNLFTKLPKK